MVGPGTRDLRQQSAHDVPFAHDAEDLVLVVEDGECADPSADHEVDGVADGQVGPDAFRVDHEVADGQAGEDLGPGESREFEDVVG